MNSCRKCANREDSAARNMQQSSPLDRHRTSTVMTEKLKDSESQPERRPLWKWQLHRHSPIWVQDAWFRNCSSLSMVLGDVMRIFVTVGPPMTPPRQISKHPKPQYLKKDERQATRMRTSYSENFLKKCPASDFPELKPNSKRESRVISFELSSPAIKVDMHSYQDEMKEGNKANLWSPYRMSLSSK